MVVFGVYGEWDDEVGNDVPKAWAQSWGSVGEGASDGGFSIRLKLRCSMAGVSSSVAVV